MARLWKFSNKTNGYERTAELWLSPDLGAAYVLDSIDPEPRDPESIVAAVFAAASDQDPDAWRDDAVTLAWGVRGTEGTAEAAPYGVAGEMDFLTHFTWPIDAETGEPLDWFRDLEVRPMRHRAFWKALGWLPAPFTRSMPLRSMASSRLHEA